MTDQLRQKVEAMYGFASKTYFIIMQVKNEKRERACIQKRKPN